MHTDFELDTVLLGKAGASSNLNVGEAGSEYIELTAGVKGDAGPLNNPSDDRKVDTGFRTNFFTFRFLIGSFGECKMFMVCCTDRSSGLLADVGSPTS